MASGRTVTWVQRLTRAGWLSKGFVFVVIGLIAVRLATQSGPGDTDATQVGALRALADEPFGAVLIVAIACGLLVFMVWNLAQAVVPASTELDLLGVVQRVGWAGLGLFYGTVAVAGFRILAEDPEVGSSDRTDPSTLTAQLMATTPGRLLVVVAACVVAAVAAYHLNKGLRYDFVDDLDTDDLDESQERWLGRLGVSGFVARAFVLAVVAFFLLKAAIEFDADQAVGLDGALRQLTMVMYGRVLGFAVGLGLFVAGVYDMVTFRRQRLE